MRRLYELVKADGYAPATSTGSGFPAGFTPTSAARLYAYAGIAMYEAVLPGMATTHRSLAGQLNDMPAMTIPTDRGVPYDWPAVLSAAVAATVGPMFPRESSRTAVQEFLAIQLSSRRSAGTPPGIVNVSARHGRRVAEALSAWIATDGYTTARELDGVAYEPPVGQGMWESTPPNFGPAIEPNWGASVRTFVLTGPEEVPCEPHVPYSEVQGSEFWNQAMATYDFERTEPQKAIARFWTDNPGQSGLPSGHWMLTISHVADQDGLRLDEAVEAYARTGVALADAFTTCWYHKYRFNLLRPVTYVNRVILRITDANPYEHHGAWRTFVNTPQFPEYTSGHSVSSLAAATVLHALLGERRYTDANHDWATIEPEYRQARTFGSFLDAAEEAAQSRIYGGIHFPMGVDVGMDQGRAVGALVTERVHTRR